MRDTLINSRGVMNNQNRVALKAAIPRKFEGVTWHRGFTLVELVTVMVIVGILAVVALPRFFTVSQFEDRGSADQVKALLRYTQKVAIAQHRNVGVAISGGAATPNCTTTLTAGALTCAIKSVVAAQTVTFDAQGRLVPNAQMVIAVGTAPSLTNITIEADTGYVH